jgi:uncharacterized protein YkvS
MTQQDIVQRLRASLAYDTPARYPEMVVEAAGEIVRLRAALRNVVEAINDNDDIAAYAYAKTALANAEIARERK